MPEILITDHAVDRYRERVDPSAAPAQAREALRRLARVAKYGRVPGVLGADEQWSAGDVVFIVRRDAPDRLRAVTIVRRPEIAIADASQYERPLTPAERRDLAEQRGNALRVLDAWRDGVRVSRRAAEYAAGLLEIALPDRAGFLPDMRRAGETAAEATHRRHAMDTYERWARGVEDGKARRVSRQPARAAAKHLGLELCEHGAWRSTGAGTESTMPPRHHNHRRRHMTQPADPTPSPDPGPPPAPDPAPAPAPDPLDAITQQLVQLKAMRADEATADAAVDTANAAVSAVQTQLGSAQAAAAAAAASRDAKRAAADQLIATIEASLEALK